MKFVVEIEPAKDPDAVGEYLRSMFFQQEDGLIGCYSSFVWDPNVRHLKPLIVDCSDSCLWARGERAFLEGDSARFVECRYYWDGDGTLVFLFLDGTELVNHDCKKDHGWIFQKQNREALKS